MIYLDNAATSWPKPESVYRVMDEFLRNKGGNPGHGSHSLAEAARQIVDETRLVVARFINAETVERVIFTHNCTDSINMGLKGLLKAGDHVVVSSLEHNAVMRPLNRLAGQGVKFTKVPISPTTGVTSPDEVEDAITPATRLILMIHASNVNGVVQPVAEYGEIAHRHSIPLMVDAAQTAGHYPLDVQSSHIDLIAFSGHKGPLGPPGLGVLYISPRVSLETLREGGTGSSSESETQPDQLPNKYESGTVNSLGIAGLGAGLQFINSEGLEHVRSHEHDLVTRLKEGLRSIPGLTLYAAKNEKEQAPVISLTLGSYEPGEVGAILDQAFDIKVRTGLHCAPEAHRSIGTFPKGTIRLSPGYLNTTEQIEKTVEAIKKIAGAGRKK